MADSNRIFRQAALDRLSSPEQLDQLMQVTTPRSWLALAACCALVVTAVAWGVWGSIRITVHGRGILIKHGGVFVATAFGDGRVADILVKSEDLVASNQLLAVLQVPDLKLKIDQAGMLWTNLQIDLRKFTNYLEEERRLETNYQRAEIKAYQLMSDDYEKQVSALTDRVLALDGLNSGTQGNDVVDRPTLLAASNELFSARHGLDLTGVQMKQVDVNRMQVEERRNQLLVDKQVLLDQAKANLDYLNTVYKLTSEIRSPFEGTVLEITIKTNQLVNANTPIMSLQSSQEKLEGLLFLAPGEGKRVRKKMKVHLAPASAKKEHFGMMVGELTTVSPLPATPQMLLSVLQNPTLVSEFSQGGAPIYVWVHLLSDPKTISGLRWTSGVGPSFPITSGTLCEGTITLTNKHPVSIVLSWVKDSAIY